jgi:hypothetical protein
MSILTLNKQPHNDDFVDFIVKFETNNLVLP